MTQSDAEHALDYAELRHVPTEDEIGYESLPYSPEKLRQIKEYLDNPGPYNAQSRQSTEGRYARAILADLIDARAELQAERERVRQMEEALQDVDAWFEAAATRGAKTPMKAHELRAIVKDVLDSEAQDKG